MRVPKIRGRAMRWPIVVALVLGMLGPVARSRADEEKKPASPPTSFYAVALVRGRMGHRIIYYWSKGDRMRAETVIAAHPVVTIVNGDRYYALDRLRRRGVSIARSPVAVAEDAKRDRPFGNELEELQRAGGEMIEETTLGRTKAQIWRVTDEQGKRKLWVSAGSLRVPLRLDVFDRGAAETVTTDYSDWTFDRTLDDEFFVPPADFALESFGYDEYVQKSIEGPVGTVPVLYPDLLHGRKPR